MIASNTETGAYVVYFTSRVADHDEQLELLCVLAAQFKVDPDQLESGDVVFPGG